MGDQHPTNTGDEDEEIVADVDIPGPYPTGRGDPTGEPLSTEPEPTKESRDAGSLGDLVHGSGAPMPGQEAGRAANPAYDNDPEAQTSQEEVKKLKAESYPGGVPEDADLGSGRQKGQGLPPGSVGRGHDTPQTPAT